MRISAIIPACISGAADWLLKCSASIEPQQAATAAIAATISVGDQRGRRCRGSRRRSRSATAKHEGGRDQRPGAGREHRAGEQHPARGGGDEQPVEPALLDVAGEVDAGRGPGEAGALQHADRDDEALVAAGVEAVQLGQRAEDAVEAEEEDRRRQHPGDRRAGHPQQLVLGPRHQRRDRRQVGAPGRDRDRRLHQPTLSRWRRARALSTRPSSDDAGDREHRVEHVGGRRSRR